MMLLHYQICTPCAALPTPVAVSCSPLLCSLDAGYRICLLPSSSKMQQQPGSLMVESLGRFLWLQRCAPARVHSSLLFPVPSSDASLTRALTHPRSFSLPPSLSAFDLADMGKNISSKSSAYLTKASGRMGIICDRVQQQGAAVRLLVLLAFHYKTAAITKECWGCSAAK